MIEGTVKIHYEERWLYYGYLWLFFGEYVLQMQGQSVRRCLRKPLMIPGGAVPRS